MVSIAIFAPRSRRLSSRSTRYHEFEQHNPLGTAESVPSLSLEARKRDNGCNMCQLTDGRRPMQFILIVVTIAAAILFDVRPSGAYQGPWCAVENVGGTSGTIAAGGRWNSASL